MKQTFTYIQENRKKDELLERIRGYTFLQLKCRDNIEKWLAIQNEIEQLEYRIRAIEIRRRQVKSWYKNGYSTVNNY